jgi:hypothetical protein
MLMHRSNPRQAWKRQSYSAPMLFARAFRLKASALRQMQSYTNRRAPSGPVRVMVPALYSLLPGETFAMGWLNEIDALAAVRHRTAAAAKITGWDAFTFHTQHNLDAFFDSSIAAVHDIWVKEGTLTMSAVRETKRQFRKPYDYHRIQPRLIENLVFQSSFIDWIRHHANDVPLQFHVTGTALLAALVSYGALSFESAVSTALKIGASWDNTLNGAAADQSEDEIGWSRFEQVRKLIEGRSALAVGVSEEDIPAVDAPSNPFLYSRTAKDEGFQISTANDAAAALETMSIASWSSAVPNTDREGICAWLVSCRHPIARVSHWSVSNYLLATPAGASLFLDHIAPLGRQTLVPPSDTENFQNRLRLSRMKVTGP